MYVSTKYAVILTEGHQSQEMGTNPLVSLFCSNMGAAACCLGPSSFELICKVAKAILHGQLDHFLSLNAFFASFRLPARLNVPAIAAT